ncbi:hypothetical protein [Streptomyces sp. NBC_00316]|uniref:hypothetical protein n=1 Tax=Streptomyces sp. NBC_00316 TaxID=2975710 RepID=UPI002E2AA857|nr:hypothetical protein [Streptomyces sp. NBC_00316]
MVDEDEREGGVGLGEPGLRLLYPRPATVMFQRRGRPPASALVRREVAFADDHAGVFKSSDVACIVSALPATHAAQRRSRSVLSGIAPAVRDCRRPR